MLDIVKTIILDFQEQELFSGIPRRLQVRSVKGKATVCIGVRRSGKSTFLFQQIERLIEGGVSRENIIYINFFDDRLYKLRHEGLALIPQAYFSLYPQKKGTEKVYFFFDEIQEIKDWEPVVERLMRTEKCEIFITGSSARMLSGEIATQMRGRALTWEVFPFSFREFLDLKNIDSKGPLSTKRKLIVEKAFADYWESGAFPEVAELDRAIRVKIHQEYFKATVLRDVVERHDISHPQAVVDLAHWLVDNVASMYSVNSLTGYLSSLGHKAPKSAVSEYLKWFEDAYFLYSVRVFDASLARSNTNPKKIYCVDHSLVKSVSSGILVNSGHLLENLVFTGLRRVTPDVFYFKSKTAKEVDFVALMPDRSRLLLQVCESLSDAKTKKREIAALEEAMTHLKIKTGTIVTRNEEELIRVESGQIEVVPAWRFLLDLPENE